MAPVFEFADAAPTIGPRSGAETLLAREANLRAWPHLVCCFAASTGNNSHSAVYYDDDLTDDQQVCDVGCQLEFAAGSLAMILGFVMCSA